MEFRAVVLAAAMIACAAAARAQDVTVDPDRPDVTNGTHLVPAGLIQVEFGALYSRTHPDFSSAGSPFTVRIGLNDWIEARIDADGMTSQSAADTRATGFGDVQFGAKLRLWSEPGGIPVLSILPAVNLPTADANRGLGSGDTDYTLAVLTGADFLHRGHIDVNYAIGAIGAGQNRPHFAQHLVSASLSDAVTDRWNPYVELFWFSRAEIAGTPETTLDTGVIYELGSRVAIDGGVAFGVSGPSDDFGAFGGLSLLFGGEGSLNGRQRRVKKPVSRRR